MRCARCLFIALVLALLATLASTASAQQSLLPLTLVVRDGGGSPLAGVTLNILLAGPPHEPYDNCVTDPAGQCRLMLPAGAYVVTFSAGWRGREFIPAEQQNGGAASDGGYGGFGINFAESEQEQIVTFVIGQRADGLLVPLWDMSRDSSALPQPFAMPSSPLDSPEKALEGISLAPLDTMIPSSDDLSTLRATAGAAPEGTPTAQEVVSNYGQPPTPTSDVAALITQAAPANTLAEDGLPVSEVMLGLVGLLILAGIFVVVVALRARRAK